MEKTLLILSLVILSLSFSAFSQQKENTTCEVENSNWKCDCEKKTCKRRQGAPGPIVIADCNSYTDLYQSGIDPFEAFQPIETVPPKTKGKRIKCYYEYLDSNGKKINNADFVDAKGNKFNNFKFDYAEPFVEGLAIVRSLTIGGLYAYESWHIKPDGNRLYKNHFNHVWPFINDYAVVDKTGGYKMFHINKEGERIYRQTYIGAEAFNENGKAMVQKTETMYAIIDVSGKELITRNDQSKQSCKKWFDDNGYFK
jgi:hypothetical protein